MTTTEPRVDLDIERTGCPDLHESNKWRMPFFMHGDRIIGHMAAFKQHCVLGFWRGRGRDAAEHGQSDEAMGQFGHITAVNDLPPKRECCPS